MSVDYASVVSKHGEVFCTYMSCCLIVAVCPCCVFSSFWSARVTFYVHVYLKSDWCERLEVMTTSNLCSGLLAIEEHGVPIEHQHPHLLREAAECGC